MALPLVLFMWAMKWIKISGTIKCPITMANSYALPYAPTDMN